MAVVAIKRSLPNRQKKISEYVLLQQIPVEGPVEKPKFRNIYLNILSSNYKAFFKR